MKQIFVLAEHRKGQLRDTTWEAIAAGRKLAADLGVELSCLLLGSNTDSMAEILAKECPKVIAVDDPSVRNISIRNRSPRPCEPYCKTVSLSC